MNSKHLVGEMMKISREHRKIVERKISSLGIHPSQHHLLMYLSCNAPATQSSIAEAMGISAATVAVSLKKLEKGNYIEKTCSPEDNRSNQIRLTKKGEDVVVQSERLFDEVDGKMFQSFTEEQKEQLHMLLEQIIKNVDEI